MATRKVTTKRRKRVRPRKTAVVTTAVTRKAEDKLDAIRDLMIKQEALAVELQESKADLEKFMKAQKLDKVTMEDIIAEMKAPVGRTVRVVRVPDFKKLVSPAEFMASVTVGITAAKEVLSGKELESVCDTTPPAEKPPVLNVKMVKPKG